MGSDVPLPHPTNTMPDTHAPDACRSFTHNDFNHLIRRNGSQIDVFLVGGNPKEPMRNVLSRNFGTVSAAKAFMDRPVL